MDKLLKVVVKYLDGETEEFLFIERVINYDGVFILETSDEIGRRITIPYANVRLLTEMFEPIMLDVSEATV